MYCLLGLNRFSNQIENKMHSPLHYMEIMKQIEKVCTVKVWKILEERRKWCYQLCAYGALWLRLVMQNSISKNAIENLVARNILLHGLDMHDYWCGIVSWIDLCKRRTNPCLLLMAGSGRKLLLHASVLTRCMTWWCGPVSCIPKPDNGLPLLKNGAQFHE
jgi:hypothetical protein